MSFIEHGHCLNDCEHPQPFTSDAKIEVEAYIAATAQRIGLNHISQLGQIEYKEKPNAE